MSERTKYPRTPHLPWSPGRTSDDKIISDLSALKAAEVVITTKMDGEATTVYSDGYTHARSLESGPHVSRDHVRALAARIGYQIPTGWRICGENVWAVHSIVYDALPAAFLVYNVWDENNRALSWSDTETVAAELGLVTVPVVYRGRFLDRAGFDALWADLAGQEGYVVRTELGFGYADFGTRVAKYVRADHVQTGDHWVHREVQRNTVLDLTR